MDTECGERPKPEVNTQFAALCWRVHKDEQQVLLITSRDTGRWVIPKGWPMKGRDPSEAAAREAWEEAGVTGTAITDAIGSYSYDKTFAEAPSLSCEVQVFPLEVEGLEDSFPEAKQRRRKWFSLEKAARKVAEPELRQLILGFAGLCPDLATVVPADLAERAANTDGQICDVAPTVADMHDAAQVTGPAQDGAKGA